MPPKSKKTAATTSHPILLLTKTGDVTAKDISCAGPLTHAAIQTYLKSKDAQLLGTYKYKSLLLSLFGSTEGSEDDLNQHQLPPPHDTIPLYEDIVLVASKFSEGAGTPTLIAEPFTPEEYEEFYTKVFDGEGEEEEQEDE